MNIHEYKNKLSLLLVILFSFGLIACSDNDDPAPQAQQPASAGTIVDIAVADGRFTTLVAALQAAGLDDDLQGDGPFTVFAPTDEAFDLLPAGTVDALLETANSAQLTDILTYHVFAGDVLAADAIALAGSSVDMLNGAEMTIDVEGDSVILNLGGNRPATVIITDIIADNGVIHVIDAVLNPDDGRADIVDTAVADGRFSTLVTALQTAGLDDALKAEGPFTVFAPTDEAFNRLPAGTVAALLEPANRDLLTDILTYHVFSGKVLAADAIALAGSSVDMLNGAGMTINVEEGAVILNFGGNRPATVIITDILATNGVIHVIDAVLDPADAP